MLDSESRGPPQLDDESRMNARRRSYRRFTAVTHPACNARRWHISAACTPPDNPLAPHSLKLCCTARDPHPGALIHQATRSSLRKDAGVNAVALNAVSHRLGSGTHRRFYKLLGSEVFASCAYAPDSKKTNNISQGYPADG